MFVCLAMCAASAAGYPGPGTADVLPLHPPPDLTPDLVPSPSPLPAPARICALIYDRAICEKHIKESLAKQAPKGMFVATDWYLPTYLPPDFCKVELASAALDAIRNACCRGSLWPLGPWTGRVSR